MGHTPKLSVAVITFNEENNIKPCLDSIADIADEIIILDSFSKDKTEEICRGYPQVKFSQHPFNGHIQQKNRALELCSHEWILSLDADERVSPELKQSIITFLQSAPDANGAKFPRLTFHLGKFIRHSGWYPNARYRLIRKGKGHWGGENPHDTIILQGKGVMLKGDLIHYSFKDLSHYINTLNTFSTIAAFSRQQQGKRFRLIRLFVKPLGKFVETYIVKRGFMDGLAGWIIAISSTYYAFLREAKLYELNKLDIKRPSNLPPFYKDEKE